RRGARLADVFALWEVLALRGDESRGVRADAPAGLETRERGHVVLAQLEVEEVDVLADPLGRHRLGDDHVAELEVPAQDGLSRGLVVVGGDRLDRAVFEQGTLRERAPGLGGDAVLGVPGP